MRRKLVVLLILALTLLAADRPPWRARRRVGVRPNRLAAQHVKPSDWAREPTAPPSIDSDRFAAALRKLCGWMPPRRAENYTRWTLDATREFDQDPFVLGALIYRMSRCRPKKEELDGLGLTLLAPRMYSPGFKRRTYHYRVLETGSWKDRTLSLPRFPFNRQRLLHAQSNLYFTAAALAVWRDQHTTVDAGFEQVSHRHYLSHFIWGDRVRSARAEDRILTDRRRLLQYYGHIDPPGPIERVGLSLGAPLDGAPRVVSSGLGFDRGSGRRHRGIDIESEFGEPVRALAAGRVVFAGIDLPGKQNNQILPPQEINTTDRGTLGRGGRYLCIKHARSGQSSLRSCYMHLETVEVAAGTDVQRGQRIGTVGRTGMKRSSPHLHLELHGDRELLDPLEVIRGHVIGQPAEWDGY